MAKLPKLPDPTQRKLDLQWKELTRSHGFTDEPIKLPNVRGASGELRGRDHQVSYEQAIGDALLKRTVSLAEKRFGQFAGHYLEMWGSTKDARTEVFAEWLGEIKAMVASEVAGLWAKSEWAPAFQRRCLTKADEIIISLVDRLQSRARRLEIQHLEHPHLSLESLVGADGDLKLATTLEEGKRMLELGPGGSPSYRAAFAQFVASQTTTELPASGFGGVGRTVNSRPKRDLTTSDRIEAAAQDDPLNPPTPPAGFPQTITVDGAKRTHRANHDGSPRPERENRIVWKCMAELGLSGGNTTGAERPMASTNRGVAFRGEYLAPREQHTSEHGFGEPEMR